MSTPNFRRLLSRYVAAGILPAGEGGIVPPEMGIDYGDGEF